MSKENDTDKLVRYFKKLADGPQKTMTEIAMDNVNWPYFRSKAAEIYGVKNYKEGRTMHKKQFYLISALKQDSNSFGQLCEYPTKKAAIERAKEIIEKRANEGQPEIGFYILKVETYVGSTPSPIKVRELSK